MHFTIPRMDLLDLVGTVQAAVPTKPAMPIVSHLLIEAKDDQLVLTSTDLTLTLQTYATAQVRAEGGVAIPARKLFSLVRELTAPVVELHQQTPEIVSINAGSSHFKMSGIHKAEFPLFPSLETGWVWEVDNRLLHEMLTRSVFAAARDDNRQVLNGILIQHRNKEAIFVGTDGKKLARLSTGLELDAEQPASYILPLKAVEEMIKLLDTKERSSKLTFMKDKAALETGNVLLVSKLMGGQYPDVDQVIPSKSPHPISLHREELISLLRQVSLFTMDSDRAARVSFTQGTLRLAAGNHHIGEGNVSMSVNYNGPPLEIALNPNHFLDILRHSHDEVVHFSCVNPYSPGLITDSTQAQFVLMPMRIDP